MGNLPVRHTVMKQLETTLIQRLDVDSTLDGILDQLCAPETTLIQRLDVDSTLDGILDQLCAPERQALSVAKPRLLC